MSDFQRSLQFQGRNLQRQWQEKPLLRMAIWSLCLLLVVHLVMLSMDWREERGAIGWPPSWGALCSIARRWRCWDRALALKLAALAPFSGGRFVLVVGRACAANAVRPAERPGLADPQRTQPGLADPISFPAHPSQNNGFGCSGGWREYASRRAWLPSLESHWAVPGPFRRRKQRCCDGSVGCRMGS